MWRIYKRAAIYKVLLKSSYKATLFGGLATDAVVERRHHPI
jgi:hypothetical protein